mmetsp:Transcript_45266/g.81858  ORF Transcript_45266/g.81858 Transcript_45266/m.81858 type:complete len:525 (-) Transcript_45266:68-1642(-)
MGKKDRARKAQAEGTSPRAKRRRAQAPSESEREDGIRAEAPAIPQGAARDSDDEPLMPRTRGADDAAANVEAAAAAAAAADSDDEEGVPQATAQAAEEKDSDSSSSSDSESESSSSSSSSSSSEDSDVEVGDAEEADAEEAGEDEDEEKEGVKTSEDKEKERQMQLLGLIREAQLRRDELETILADQPPEDHEDLVKGAFVRITVGKQIQGQIEQNCLLAEITGVEPSPAYELVRQNKETRTLRLQLKCRRDSSERLLKVSAVSNQPATENEMRQWVKLMHRSGKDTDLLVETVQLRAQAVVQSKHIKYDEATVGRILAGKPSLEFNAQKESRMRFLVQAVVSQMDISGIRESEVEDLEVKFKESVGGLHKMEHKALQMQEAWFKARPNLFSIREINRNNEKRQILDDRHALEISLEEELNAAGKTLNPYQRRDCRPVSAWDTSLTPNLGKPLDQGQEAAAEAAAAAAVALKATSVAAAKGAAAAESSAAPKPGDRSRVDGFLQAHRRGNLLAQFGALMTSQAA